LPTRLHRPRQTQPNLLDRYLSHPWEVGVVSGVWIALGAVLCWSWVGGPGPSTVLGELLPPWAAGGVSIALLASGLGVLTAVVWTGKDSTAWRIELLSLPLGIASWVAYALVSPSLFWQILAVGYVIGGIGRFVAGWLNMRRPAQVIVLVGRDTA